MKNLAHGTHGIHGRDGREEAQEAQPTVEDFRAVMERLQRVKRPVPTRLEECLIAASPQVLRDLAEMDLPTKDTKQTKGGGA